jgi:hypothetical protein
MTNQQAWPIESIGPKNYDGNRPVKLTNGVLFHADDDELAAAGITPPRPRHTHAEGSHRSVHRHAGTA